MRTPAWTRRHPEWAAVGVAAGAWVILLLWQHPAAAHVVTGDTPAMSGQAMPGHLPHGSGAASVVAAVFVALPMVSVMSAAMMIPAAVPAIRHVGFNTLRWRRQRAIAVFLAAFLAPWIAFGAGVVAVISVLNPRGEGATVLAISALVAALLWPVLPWQSHFRRLCHRTVPLPLRGVRAARSCAQFGLRQSVTCIGLCAPLMVVMLTTMGLGVAWMAALTAVAVAAKFPPRALKPVLQPKFRLFRLPGRGVPARVYAAQP